MGAPYVIGTPKANGLSFYLRHAFCIHLFYLVLHNLQFHGSWIMDHPPNLSAQYTLVGGGYWPGICRATHLPR